MFADARRLPRGGVLETDLCIVGAGAAGITLARSFIDTPVQVVLLESGGFEPDDRTQALYKGRSIGLPYFPLESARVRYFGGSTNHWGAHCRPFEALDFEPRDWVPFSGWPIRKPDLDPYYRRAREVLSLRSDDFSDRSWVERDHLSPFALGERTTARVIQYVDWGSRSFGENYREEIRRAPNISAYLHANVTEIDTDEAGRVATRVHVATLTGNRFAVKARHFVLAVGGIDNPRLLLASNRRRPQGLGNQHGLVGRFFQEHARFAVAIVAPANRTLRPVFYEPHHVGDVEIRGYVAFPPEVKRAERLVDVQVEVDPVYDVRFRRAFVSEEVKSLKAFAHGRGAKSVDAFGRNLMNVVADLTTGRDFTVPGAPLPVPYPEIVAKLSGSTGELRDHIPDLLGDVTALGYKRLAGPAPLDHLRLITRLEPTPNPDSRVTLTRSRDELGVPRTQLDWRISSIDWESAARAVEILGGAFGRAGLGRLRTLVGERQDWRGDWHHIGTTRMSDDPTRGVVDRNCRVHGAANLFIAGSSVFPTAGSSAPTLTIVALALRLADHLKRVMR